MKFSGCGTALITPFSSDLSVDETAFRRLVQRQVDAGIDFLVPCGTTGESPTLSFPEKEKVISIAVEVANGKVPVMAGAGGYDTAEVIHAAKRWVQLGVDAILSVSPYYNKPTQEGIFQHYRAIAESVAAPILIYNVPGRTGSNIEPATLLRLAEVDSILGVKEASGNVAQMASILARVPKKFLVLSGDDSLTIPLISLGGHGIISVAANQIPGQMTKLTQAALQGDFAAARALQQRFQLLMETNFVESNPIPVKEAMAQMGLCQPIWRLPMCPPSADTQEKIRTVLSGSGLL
jgi:4-hydroxy-tetrahydrodipicolinate synthase